MASTFTILQEGKKAIVAVIVAGTNGFISKINV